MLVHGDSFEHYGTTPNGGRDAMTAGYWASVDDGVGGNFSISSDVARTGTKSLKLTPGAGNAVVAARVAFGGAPRFTFGIGVAIYMATLPAGNDRIGYQFRDNTNTPILTICFQSDGSITARKGDHTGTVIDISDSILQAGTFNHVETKATFDTVAGFVEIRVNGVTKLQIGGLNLGAAGCAQYAFVGFNGGGCPVSYFEDEFAWDDTGDENNDFVGPQRILTYFAIADTAQADWSKVGDADGFDCIDNVPADGDTTYLGSDTIGDKSDFALPTLPPETAEIRGIIVPVMARLDAAGIGNVLVSMISGADDAPGTDYPLTTGYTYYRNVFERDPATDARWTKAGFEAALLRIEKSA